MKEDHGSGSTPGRPPVLDIALTAAITTCIFLLFRPWEQPLVRDISIWDHVAQVIADGGVPYRDVVEIKTPLSAYLAAPAILFGRLLGIADVVSIRIVFFVIGVVLVLAVRALGARLFDADVGLVASLMTAGIDPLAEWSASGIQPKVPFVLFGIVAILLAMRDRPVASGAVVALSALCWQPGCLFILPAALALGPGLRRLTRLLLGFLLPLGLCVLYFTLAGAVADLYNWTIAFPFGPYVAKYIRSLSGARDTCWKLLTTYYSREIPLLAISAAGLAWSLATAVRRRIDRTEPLRLMLAGIAAPACLVGLVLLNVQGESDLFPIFPFIAPFASFALVHCMRLALSPGLALFVSAAVCIGWSASDSLFYRLPSTLQDEIEALEPAAALLGPNDRVWAHGDVQFLVLFNLRSVSPHLYLDRGKDAFLDRIEPDGFRKMLDGLEAAAPKIVVLGRKGTMQRDDEVVAWVRSHYVLGRRIMLRYGRDGRFIYGLRVYVRKGLALPPGWGIRTARDAEPVEAAE
ncbi:MAG: DolP-mannose mannosyltransferase [Acidobacteriota bacterium]